MSWGALGKPRLVFLSLMALMGVGCGLYLQLTKEPLPPRPKQKTVKTPYGDMVLPSIDLIGGDMEGLKIPQYAESGFRSSELRAERVLWNKDGPVQLTKPVIYEFGPDGKTVIMKVTGDHGEVEVDITARAIKGVRVWGNVRVIRSEKEENENESAKIGSHP